MTPKPGLHKGVSQNDYSRWNAVRSSDLKHFDRTPAHAHWALTHPAESTALDIGAATHCAVLEPESLEARYLRAPQLDRRTKEGKAAWAALQGDSRIVLMADDFDLCCEMRDATATHPLARELLKAPGHNEVSLAWPETLVSFGKARPDRFCMWEGYSTIVSFKTARDASPRGFARDAANLGYHVEAAWYLRGADVLSPVARRYVFLVAEKEPPYLVALYELDAEFLAAGQVAVERALTALANAKASGVWPGYPMRVGTLYAPAWLKTPEQEIP